MKIKNVKEINPESLESALTIASEELECIQNALNDHLDFLNRCCKSSGMSYLVKTGTLKLSEIRKDLHDRDLFALSKHATELEKELEPYLSVLETKGYSFKMQDELKRLIKKMTITITKYNQLLVRNKKIVENHMHLLAEYWIKLVDKMKSEYLSYITNDAGQHEFPLSNLIAEICENDNEETEPIV